MSHALLVILLAAGCATPTDPDGGDAAADDAAADDAAADDAAADDAAADDAAAALQDAAALDDAAALEDAAGMDAAALADAMIETDASPPDATTAPDAPPAPVDAGLDACARDDDPTRCGASCAVCTAPSGATATCVGGACGFDCPSGSVPSGLACVPIPAPRPISPLSTSSVSARQPTLRWSLADGTDGAHIEICAERACTTVLASFDATGSSGAPPAALERGVVFWRLQGRAAGSTGAAFSPTWQLTIPAQSAPRDASWGTIYDANGDGYGDAIATAVGRVHVYPGSATGPSPTDPVSRDGFGLMLRYEHAVSAGDVDGDGFSDLAVIATHTSTAVGHLLVHRGGPTGLAASPSAPIVAASSSEGFGTSIASAGDVNGDGYGDVIVGGARLAWIHLGGPSGLEATAAARVSGTHLSFGSAVAGLGDVTRDGHADVIIGAREDSTVGRAYLYAGSATGALSPIRTLIPGGSQTRFGFAVASAGDVDRNGYPDIAVSAPGTSSTEGIVWVYRVTATGIAATAEGHAEPGMLLGVALGPAGDLDGDGYDDVIAGAPEFSLGSGRLFVLRGGASGISSSAVEEVDAGAFFSASSAFASGIAGLGDTNGDDVPDVLVGAPLAYSSRGAAVVLRGSATTVLETVPRPNITGPDLAPAQFGRWVSGRN